MVILNIGMPRSGTLWRYKLIRDLVISSGGQDGLEIRKKYFLHPFIELPNADLNTTKAKRLLPAMIPSIFGQTYVLNTHAGPTKFAKILLARTSIKAVYGFRDPRDCILSILEYSERDLPQYSAPFLRIKSIQDAVNFMDRYIRILKGWTNIKDVLVVRYEEMLLDYEASANQIIRYLNLQIPLDKKEEILFKYLPQQKPEAGIKIHFEHGKANRYREKFTSEELNFLNETYGKILEDIGYVK